MKPTAKIAGLAHPLALTLALPLISTQTAAAAPSAGQLMSEAQQQFPTIYLPSVGYRKPGPVNWKMPEDEGPTLKVNGVRFEGNAVMSDAQLQKSFAQAINRDLTPRQIYSLTDLVKQIYAAADIAATAKVPPQDVEDGIILITINEAAFAGVELDYGFEDHFNVDLERVELIAGAAVKQTQPVKLSEMQRGQLLAIDLHGVAVSGGNQPDDNGDQLLELWVENTPTYAGTLELDNQGNRTTGELQTRLTSLYASPFQRGGATYINALKSENSSFASIAYRGPVGSQGATFDAQIGLMEFRGHQLDESNTQSYSLGYRYPVMRSVPNNLFLSLLAERRDLGYLIDTLDIALDGNIAFKLGRLTYHSQLTTGETAQSQHSGNFNKLEGQLSFSHRYGSGWRYNAELTGQLTDSELDDAERMTIGGFNGLRGYTTNDALADSGLRLRLDIQRSLSNNLRVGAFYDQARFKERKSSGQQTNLRDFGLSSSFTFENQSSLKIAYAQALDSAEGPTEKGDRQIYAGFSFPF